MAAKKTLAKHLNSRGENLISRDEIDKFIAAYNKNSFFTETPGTISTSLGRWEPQKLPLNRFKKTIETVSETQKTEQKDQKKWPDKKQSEAQSSSSSSYNSYISYSSSSSSSSLSSEADEKRKLLADKAESRMKKKNKGKQIPDSSSNASSISSSISSNSSSISSSGDHMTKRAKLAETIGNKSKGAAKPSSEVLDAQVSKVGGKKRPREEEGDSR